MKRLLALFLVVLFAGFAMAQNKGRITGTISTPEGAVLTGVRITISSDALIARTMSSVSNDRGLYRFVLLPVGEFAIKFEKEGYKTVEKSGLMLGFDSTLTINQVMNVSDFEATVMISGEAPIVDRTSSSIGAKLDTAVLQNTPSSNRDVWSLPSLAAGFSDSSSFGAVSSSGQAYNTDGVNVSDTQTKAVFSSVNLEAVEQLDVNQFGANAEYGAFTGASLNVITKSGGNEFSGELNYFMQRVDWADDNNEEYADNIATSTKSDLNSLGAALGGPIVQDRLWFFANFHYDKLETQRAMLDGNIPVTEDPRRAFIKLSNRWDDRNISQAWYSYYDYHLSHRVLTGAFSTNYSYSLWQGDTDIHTWMLQHSFIYSDDIIFEGRYAGYRGNYDLTPIPENGENLPLLWDSKLGRMLPGSSVNRVDKYQRDRDNALLTLNYYNDDLNGSHSMKFGFEYENSFGERYNKSTSREYYYGGVSYYQYIQEEFTASAIIERFAGYVQDSWSVNDRLTINAGFRYDTSGLYAADPDNAPIGDDVIYRFNDPAPRLGFAWDIAGDGKTIIRGFYGRYYEGVITGNTESFSCKKPGMITNYGNYINGASAPKWTYWSTTGGYENASVGNDMENQYSEGFTLSIEREIMENVAGSVTFVVREDHNMIGELFPDATWDTKTANYSNANGSYTGVYYPNFKSGEAVIVSTIREGDIGVLAPIYRNYQGLMFELSKRMSDNWSLKTSYTYSKSEGTLAQGYGTIQGYMDGTDPNAWVNSDGRLPLDRPHQFKFSGTYIAPFDIFISPVITFMSGQPISEYVTISGATVLIRPRDNEHRYEDQFNIDLRLEKAFIIQDKYRLGVIFDVFNLLNDDAITAYKSTYISSTSYMKPGTLVPARFYQVGFRLIF